MGERESKKSTLRRVILRVLKLNYPRAQEALSVRKVLVGFCIGLLLLLPQKALALDYLYLLLGNGQDLLILGQLVEGSLKRGIVWMSVRLFSVLLP